jgi:choice-of-anchor C domain-containing protein
MKYNVLALVAVIGLGSAPANAAVNFVSDGTFSSPSGGTSFTTYSSPSSIGPWSVASGSVDLIGNYWQDPAGTSGSVDLDGNAPGSISQSLALTSGKYELSFYLSGNPDGSPATKLLDVDLSSGSPLTSPYSYTLNGSSSHSDMQYIHESFEFTATGPTTLTFASADSGTPYGPVIGDVIVSAVPEPAAWSMLIFGIGAIGTMLRLGRRRQSSRVMAA